MNYKPLTYWESEDFEALILYGKHGQGKFALIDDEDFKWLSQWKWYVNPKGYVYRKPKSGIIYLHRLLLNTPKGYDSDHINRIKLDNRRSNLRIATRSENQQNKGRYKTNKSGTKGIELHKGKWRTRVSIDNKRIYIGRFKTLEEAKNKLDNFYLNL